jgi:predicted transcriptional regulator of viral defense system
VTLDASSRGTARTLPRGLAPIVEALELDEVSLVTIGLIDEIRLRAGIATPANVLASRLRARGWLLATRQRGVYEFAPGSHAGPLSRGSLTLPLQAALRAQPRPDVGLTFQSAAWALGLADRAPSRLEVAAPTAKTASRLSRVLGEGARVLVFTPHLPWETGHGVPVLSADSLLVHMAVRPRSVRSWASAVEWLPDIAANASPARAVIELAERPVSVAARLSYLLSGLRPDIADAVAPPPRGKVYFGPRGRLLRHDATHQIADTLLPFDPRTLPAVTR